MKQQKPKIKLGELRRVILSELNYSKDPKRLNPQSIFSSLIQRGCLMNEEGTPSLVSIDQEELGDSIDRQVDRYLANYEQNAQSEDPNASANKMEWRQLVRGIVLKEESEEGENTEENEETPDDSADDQQPAEPIKKLNLDNINVEMFSNDVARLIQNYDNLLEMKKTLLRRAINFISKNYDSQVVKELKRALKENHGLMPDKSKMDHEDEDFAAPFAGEAGPGGG